MPTNPVNIHQDFIPADVLRVQVDTSELPNQFLNPIGEYGVWGWDTAGISNTALQWNSIDSRDTTYLSHTSTTFTLRTLNPIPTWLTAGSTVYLDGGHPLIADRYYTVNSTSDFAGGRDFTVTAPAGTNMSLIDPNWPTKVYDFINTTSDVSAYLKFNSSFFETTVSQAAYMRTKLMPIQAGHWAGATLNTLSITASHTLRFFFEWLDQDGVLLSTSTSSGALSGEGPHYLDARQAPANTAYMRFKVQMYNGTGTTNPAAGARVWFSETVVTKASTSAALQTTRTNLITNPSFETNSTGWTAGANGTLTRQTSGGIQGTACMRLTSNASGVSSPVQGPTIAVTAGKTYTLSGYLWKSENPPSDVTTPSIDVWWNTGVYGGARLSLIGLSIGAWHRQSVTFTVPAGVTSLNLRTRFADVSPGGYMQWDGLLLEQTDVLKPYLDGSLTDTATKNYSWTGTAHASTSTLVEPTYAYTSPELSFSDVLGRAHTLTINREELDVGTLTISAKDSSLDPSKADLIRPGRKVRAQVLTGGSWETLYLGTISNAKVSYDLLNPDETKRPNVEITAANGVQVLANSRQPNGVAILDDLGPALYAVNLPALINGLIATPEYASANPVTYTNESASTLDVVAIARDSESGYAWVTRDNILTAWSPDQIPTTVAQTFDEDDYNPDFNVDYDTETCINSVTIKALRITGSGETQETEEWTFGPYRDIESVSEWGAYSAEFTVSVPVGAVLNDAYFQPFADAVLAANATPRLRVNSLTFLVKDEATLARSVVDLYDLVEITNTEAGITAEQMRVTGINHSITPFGWLVTLSFAHEGSVAAPQITPPLATGIPTGWQTFTKVSPAASMVNITVEYRITGNLIEWRTSGSTAADVAVPASGDIVNQNITGSIPANLRPATGNWGWPISTSGGVGMLYLTPGGTLTLATVEGTGTARTLATGASITGQSPAFVLP